MAEHMYQGADQLILFHKNTFEPSGVKIENVVISSTWDSFGIKYLVVGMAVPQRPLFRPSRMTHEA